MDRIAMFVLGAFAALTLAGPTLAQETRTDTGRAEVYKTADLLGKTVKNREGTTLGTLDDLVVDPHGKVVYAALNFKEGGTVTANTSKMFALPLKSFRMADGLKNLVLDVEKGQLDKGQGFDSNHWPTMADTGLLRGAGASRTGTADDSKRDELRRISSLNGMAIRNDRGEELGTVAGFAVSMPEEKVIYAALAHGGVAGVGSKYFAVPVSALKCANPTLRTQDACFILNANKADFDNQAGFDRNAWPIKADDRFMKGGAAGTKTSTTTTEIRKE